MANPTLAYWDIRGLAEPVRLMLEYCGVSYEDKRYVCGDAPTYDRSSWMDVKPTIGLDFPNLPYYMDGDTKMTESTAILKHVGRKNNCLLPKNDTESDRCDMLEGTVSDFRRDFVMLCYRPGFEDNKTAFFDKTFPTKMERFNQYMSDKEWISGETLTYVDFMFCEILDHVRLMQPGCYDKYENINRYLEKFFKMEKIASYRASDRFKKYPINNKMANWGGSAE